MALDPVIAACPTFRDFAEAWWRCGIAADNSFLRTVVAELERDLQYRELERLGADDSAAATVADRFGLARWVHAAIVHRLADGMDQYLRVRVEANAEGPGTAVYPPNLRRQRPEIEAALTRAFNGTVLDDGKDTAARDQTRPDSDFLGLPQHGHGEDPIHRAPDGSPV